MPGRLIKQERGRQQALLVVEADRVGTYTSKSLRPAIWKSQELGIRPPRRYEPDEHAPTWRSSVLMASAAPIFGLGAESRTRTSLAARRGISPTFAGEARRDPVAMGPGDGTTSVAVTGNQRAVTSARCRSHVVRSTGGRSECIALETPLDHGRFQSSQRLRRFGRGRAAGMHFGDQDQLSLDHALTVDQRRLELREKLEVGAIAFVGDASRGLAATDGTSRPMSGTLHGHAANLSITATTRLGGERLRMNHRADLPRSGLVWSISTSFDAIGVKPAEADRPTNGSSCGLS